jgi:FMN reductase
VPEQTKRQVLIVTVVGNPKRDSRTRVTGEAVAQRLIRLLELDGRATVRTIELADVASELFDWSSLRVRTLVQEVSANRAAIFGSQTFKATYSGILKAFLDWFDTTSLAGMVVVP